MKLYFSKGACSLTVRIILHELGLKAEYESVDLKTKMTKSGNPFIKINPKGSVPTLVTDNNEILTENVAILQFLAESQHADSLLPKVGDFKRYRVLEWLSFISSDLHKSFAPLFHPKVSSEMHADIFIPVLKTKLDYIEKSLEQKKFLTGDTFTLPDAYLFVILRWLSMFKIDIKQWPNLANFHDEVKKRKAVEDALAEERQ